MAPPISLLTKNHVGGLKAFARIVVEVERDTLAYIHAEPSLAGRVTDTHGEGAVVPGTVEGLDAS